MKYLTSVILAFCLLFGGLVYGPSETQAQTVSEAQEFSWPVVTGASDYNLVITMGDTEVYNGVVSGEVCDANICPYTPDFSPTSVKKIKSSSMGEGDTDRQGYWLVHPYIDGAYGSPLISYIIYELSEEEAPQEEAPQEEAPQEEAPQEETPPEKVNLTSQEYIDIIRASYYIANDITIISINEGLAKFTFNVYYSYTYHTHTAHVIPVIGEVGGGGVLEINAEPNGHDEGWLTPEQRTYLGLGANTGDGPFTDIFGAGELVER